MAKKAATKKQAVIMLPAIKKKIATLTIVGDRPLICHRWSEKAKKMILDKQMGKAHKAKENKDPEQDYFDSLYLVKERKGKMKNIYGFPSVAFKSAAVGCCRTLDKDIPMTLARRSFHVNGDAGNGELVTIIGQPHMREDMVRVGTGTADIRYRGEFVEWACKVKVKYLPFVISLEQLVNLFNLAGFTDGVGERRPGQTNFDNGMFHVKEVKG